MSPYAERVELLGEVLPVERRRAQRISGTMRHDDARILLRGRERAPSSITQTRQLVLTRTLNLSRTALRVRSRVSLARSVILGD